MRLQTFYLLREVYSEAVKTIIAVESEQCEYSVREMKVYFIGFQTNHYKIPDVIEYSTEVERLSKIKGLVNDDCGIPIDSIEELVCSNLNLDSKPTPPKAPTAAAGDSGDTKETPAGGEGEVKKEEKKDEDAEENVGKKTTEDTWSHYELKLESDANYLEALKHDHIIPIMSYDLCSTIVHWPEAHFKYVDKLVEKAWVDGLKEAFG